MKKILKRRVAFEGEIFDVKFEYWPATWDTRTQPGDPAEINILSITDLNGGDVAIPVIEDDGGDGKYEKLTQVLFDCINSEW